MSEIDCNYVSSRGILKSCDVKSATPYSSIRILVNYDFSQLRDGDCLYICNSAIPFFREHVFPTIQVAFRLVSGDCDDSCPSELFPEQSAFLKFIDDPRIIVWYAQNCIRGHKKLHQLPIGQDYHTMNGPNSWGPPTSPTDQERFIDELRAKAPALENRKCMAHANFHFSMTTKYVYDRHDALNQIPKELVYYEPARCGRLDTWKTQTEYAFVISPHGNGLDCHRTWEALALGCIPIVKTSALDPMYEGLPVKIVNDWHDITHELLDQTQKEYAERTDWKMEKLTLVYWMNQIRTNREGGSSSHDLELDSEKEEVAK
jgi:hypothetical protein